MSSALTCINMHSLSQGLRTVGEFDAIIFRSDMILGVSGEELRLLF
jgi:hypothetical protein